MMATVNVKTERQRSALHENTLFVRSDGRRKKLTRRRQEEKRRTEGGRRKGTLIFADCPWAEGTGTFFRPTMGRKTSQSPACERLPECVAVRRSDGKEMEPSVARHPRAHARGPFSLPINRPAADGRTARGRKSFTTIRFAHAAA